VPVPRSGVAAAPPLVVSGYVGCVLRRLCALAASFVVSGFAFLLVTGEYTNDGPRIVYVTENHGLHAGDLFVGAGWAVAMLAIAVLVSGDARVRGRGPGRSPSA
jgi:hypothetical protein